MSGQQTTSPKGSLPLTSDDEALRLEELGKQFHLPVRTNLDGLTANRDYLDAFPISYSREHLVLGMSELGVSSETLIVGIQSWSG